MASWESSGDVPCSGSSAIVSEPPLWVTEMFTTAGDTFLTSGAKLSCCISAIGEVIVSAAAFPTGGGLFVPAGFSAHTKGESASVAPSPKPSAAARLLRSQGRRPFSSLSSTNWFSCHAGMPGGPRTATRESRSADNWVCQVTGRFQVD